MCVLVSNTFIIPSDYLMLPRLVDAIVASRALDLTHLVKR